MKRVIIESPYAGDIERNTIYARRALKHCLDIGWAPFASHLLYTQVYDDNIPALRQIGMAAGWTWIRTADLVVFFIDYGMSPGMERTKEICDIMEIATAAYNIGKND